MILISSLFTLMVRNSMLLSLIIKAVSSANSRTRNDEALIYTENQVGPRIEPCGTTHLVSFNEDFTLLVYTY